ncbi:MAG: endo-1,4-beta-xylanase [Sedimentisphaerales bacterium]|nr:endo-1,4-beta-xylanase [Sedimentisphaerales bacterium]
MNRRSFLKSLAAGTAALTVPAGPRIVSAAESEQILAEADGRIEKRRKADAALKLLGPDGRPLKPGLPVKIAQQRHKFLFGCNLFKLHRCRTPQDSADYEKHFADMLNFATLPFYWWNYERQQGVTNDPQIEQMVRWCKDHNITAKGHPLAWNYVEQKWLPDDPQAAMQLQFKRIERCVRKFKGGIDIWDVVNEATHYDRDQCKENAPKLTEAIRKMGIGAYVRAAFKAARNASPDATLLINDYRTDPDYPNKVINELVDNGKPLYDVIGIQSHMHGGYWGAKRTWEVCDYFAKFGVPLHFTETTIVSGPRSQQGWLTTPDGEIAQARDVAEFYTVLFSHPAIEAITWWDFTDQGAWQQAPAGFLRADMTPKPAYHQLKALIKGKWWTKAEVDTVEGGKAEFRGFLGQYELTATVEGRTLTGAFTLDKAETASIEVKLA